MAAPAIRTTCPYCGVGCGVLARAGGASIEGDPAHPANAGRLCSKGSALAETIGLEGRLLAPRVHGRETGWDSALDLVARRFNEAIAAHGPDSVAFYVSGQMLTEDYYVANKLMKGFIGSANIDTNSRLCMASTVAGHKRAFGTDTVPGQYEDLEQAGLVVLTGSNLAWCHPVLYQRLAAAKAANPALKVVTIDPRRTATADLADLHLPLKPGSDVALFNGLLAHLAGTSAVDRGFTARHVGGVQAALAAARADGPAEAATGLGTALLTQFYRLWAETEKVVTVFSQGVNQSTSGTDKVNAIINCHLATGRIGRPGMGPFSVTGQPNAMGGREAGGLANALACHLDLENPAHRAAVRDFWNAPRMPDKPGLKALDMFSALGRGRIKALWIIHTNPAVTLPGADAVRDAIAGCEFTVVSDITAATDTARLADVLLPAAAWGEKDGTVTNSERCISRQRAFLPLPGQARPDWQILAEAGRRMGHRAAFGYAGPADIFREYAALSGAAARLGSDFDISGLAGISDRGYDALDPVHWPVSAQRSGGRFFGGGRFFTPDGRARMLPLRAAAPAAAPSPEYPFVLNTGRTRDHWHTMTRSALSPRLSAHMAEPFLEIHPRDARALGLAPATLAEVSSPSGRALLRVLVTERVQPGQVFAPMHWTAETASAGRIGALIPAAADPHSGQPESKAAVCAVRPFPAAAYGFALSRTEPQPDTPYWVKARAQGGWRCELAFGALPASWEDYARGLFGAGAAASPVSVSDPHRGGARIAFLEDGRLAAALFVSRGPVSAARAWLAAALGSGAGAEVLPGRPGAGRADPGATVCACFDVGVNTITAAIAARNLTTAEEIGAALQAGTNCGSCKPELEALLKAAAPRMAAE